MIIKVFYNKNNPTIVYNREQQLFEIMSISNSQPLASKSFAYQIVSLKYQVVNKFKVVYNSKPRNWKITPKE